MSTPEGLAAPVRRRPVDRTISWLLYALQLVLSAALSIVWLTSVMMTDSCGSSDTDALVCSMAYFGAVFLGYGLLVAALAVATPVAIAVAIRRRRASWPWATGALVLLAVATVAFVLLMTR